MKKIEKKRERDLEKERDTENMKMENIALEKDRKRVRQIWLGMEREK